MVVCVFVEHSTPGPQPEPALVKAAPPVFLEEYATCGGPAGHHTYLCIQYIIEIGTFRGSSGVCERERSMGREEQR